MSGWVGLQSADSPASWFSAVSVGWLFLEDCDVWDEPDSEWSPHPVSRRTNKDVASTHPNHTLFSCATMVAPSLRVRVCVSHGNQRTTHREPSLPADRTLDLACLRPVLTQVCTSQFTALAYVVGPPGRRGPAP